MKLQQDDFKSQYDRELTLQEIHSNRHTLMGFFWFWVALGFVWLLTVTGIFEVDKALVSTAFVISSVLFVPPLYISLRGDLSKPWLKYFLLTITCVTSGVIISILSYHAVLLYVIPLLFAIQYRKGRVIWFTYAVNTFTMLISSFAGFYYGICDLNLLMTSQHVRDWYTELISNNTLTLPLNENMTFIIIVFVVFPRSITLLVFSIMMQYTVNSGNADALKIAQLTYLKETDTRTSLYNKNKYTEMVADYYPFVEKVSVLFWDLNDLKKINDKYGHTMGDHAIKRLSDALHVHSNDRCRTYRIGGDEFIMIIDNPLPGEAESVITSVKGAIQKDNQTDTLKISSAIGHATGAGSRILALIEEADHLMYADKRACKEKNSPSW